MDGSWEGFWKDFGSKLGASWDQVGAKLEPKPSKNDDENVMRFWMASGELLGRSWIGFGTKNENIFLPAGRV